MEDGSRKTAEALLRAMRFRADLDKALDGKLCVVAGPYRVQDGSFFFKVTCVEVAGEKNGFLDAMRKKYPKLEVPRKITRQVQGGIDGYWPRILSRRGKLDASSVHELDLRVTF